jgi:hypothetical protein
MWGFAHLLGVYESLRQAIGEVQWITSSPVWPLLASFFI